MSVLGSQLEIDIDPEGEAVILPRHIGNTGTGCFKLHDHRFVETKHRIEGPVPPPGPGSPKSRPFILFCLAGL